MAIPKPNRIFEVREGNAGPRSRGLARSWLLAALGTAVAVGFVAWFAMHDPANPGPDVKFATIEHGDLRLGISGYGKIVPASLVSLSTPSGGRVASIDRRAGSRVVAGEAIVVLENSELQQRLQEAERVLAEKRVGLLKSRADSIASLNLARSNLEDLRDDLHVAELEVAGLRVLAEQRIVTPIELEKSVIRAKSLKRKIADATATISQLNAIDKATVGGDITVLKTLVSDVQRLHSEVADLVVASPQDATIFEMPTTLSVGTQLAPGVTVASLALGKSLAAELEIPASRAREVAVGQQATVTVNGKDFTAKVLRVDPQVVRDELTVLLEINGLESQGVFAGQPITGKITTRRLVGVTYLRRPADASPDTRGLLLVGKSGSDDFERRVVKFGAADSEHIVLANGANAGEVAVINQQPGMPD